MTDLLSIGATGINVYQRALGTVSNNIANLGTEGYSRQTTELKQNQPIQVGRGFVGTGAYFDSVSRQYDSFLEVSLQQATADLGSHEAVAEYAARLVDLVGGEKTGLATSFNKFFSAAQTLSTDPASTAFRSSFLRTSEELASSVNRLSEQLTDLGDQAFTAMQADIKSLNGLAEQLASINQQLLKKKLESEQAPAILDQRDRVLRQLSEFAGINTSIDAQGLVSVSLSGSMLKGILVDRVDALQLVAERSIGDPDSLKFSLVGGEGADAISGVLSGSIAGYTNFVESTIVRSKASLNKLVQVFVDEVNAIQNAGLDFEGNVGANLFALESRVVIDQSATRGQFAVSYDALSARELPKNYYEATWNAPSQFWEVRNGSGELVSSTTQGSELRISDLRLNISGSPEDGDVFTITVSEDAASGIRLALSSGSQIAAASMFRVTSGETNTGSTKPLVSFDSSKAGSGYPDLATSGVVSSSTTAPLGIIPSGQSSFRIDLSPDQASDGSLQLMTRDGRHLVGGAVAGIDMATVVSSADFFEPGSSYSEIYLNKPNAASGAYKDWSLEYGAISDSLNVSRVLPLKSFELEAPNTAIFEGGSIDFTILTANPNSRFSFDSQSIASTGVGAISFVENEIFVGNGLSYEKVATVVTPSVGSLDSLRVNFETGINAVINTATLNAIANKLVYSNGKDFSNPNSNLLTEISIEATQVNGPQWTQRELFDGSQLVDSGSVSTASSEYRATLRSSPIALHTSTSNVIEAGEITLNGVELGSLSKTGDALSAVDVKSWIDAANDPNITVLANNVIEVDLANLDLTGKGLVINGTSVISLNTGLPEDYSDVQDLIASINSVAATSGVIARLNTNGSMSLLNNVTSGLNIELSDALSGSTNALGLGNGTYTGQVEIIQDTHVSIPLILELSGTGTPSDLASIGLTTSVRMTGDIDEEIGVFLMGGDASINNVERQPTGEFFVDGLRDRLIQVSVTDDGILEIKDLISNSLLAERAYSGETTIQYQGLTLAFERVAEPGDTFVLDGNNTGNSQAFDAQGNNENILQMVALQSKPVISGGYSIVESYLGLVGDAGNQATQAEIAAEAGSVLKDQAMEARDRVSGVSLDREAADLIRFQQAYQASAQVMQVATKLFDAILQVR